MTQHFKLKQGHTYVCGILNVTPDSFSDGNLWFNKDQAINHGLDLADQGAEMLDIGAESTRPGSQLVSAEREINRLKDVIGPLHSKLPLPLSVDTRKSAVAEFVLDQGASIINDVSGLMSDPQMASLIAEKGAYLIIMFNPAIARPDHQASQNFPSFNPDGQKYNPNFSSTEFKRMADMPIMDLARFYLERSLKIALQAGIKKEQIWLDPGIGFALSQKENLLLLQQIDLIKDFGFPIFLGVSRKRFLGEILLTASAKESWPWFNQDQYASQLDLASAALTSYAATKGISIVRTHTVQEQLIAARVGEALRKASLAEDKLLKPYQEK